MLKKDLKIIKLIIGLIIFQSVLYLLAKLSPFHVNILISSWDLKIPFISHFIYFYISWYLMLALVPYLLYKWDTKCFKEYMISAVVSIIIVFFIYFFYPTTMQRIPIASKGISNIITNIIYTIDTPILNCFPSMHCLLCFLYIFNAIKCKNMPILLKICLMFWSILVILSTLFVKQHILIDIISAFIISFVIFIVVSYINKNKLS